MPVRHVTAGSPTVWRARHRKGLPGIGIGAPAICSSRLTTALRCVIPVAGWPGIAVMASPPHAQHVGPAESSVDDLLFLDGVHAIAVVDRDLAGLGPLGHRYP